MQQNSIASGTRASVALVASALGSTLAFLTIGFSLTGNLIGQESDDQVAATVGDNKIYVSQVEHEFRRKFANRDVGEELKSGLRFQILQQLCNQQLILERLASSDLYATDDEVDLETSRLRERLQQIEKPLEVFLTENGQSMAGLRFNFRWQISWKRYLDKTLTDETLEKYFQRHRRQFDGTRIHAAHLLLKIPKDDPNAVKTITSKLDELREQIVKGDFSWDEVVAKHSQAPSAKKAGDAGWIEFSRPMSRNFTEAAFQLEVGEISLPVQTPFGIHLIKCVEIQSGTIPWYDAKNEIRKVATQDLFRRVSDKQRKQTEVRLTGVVLRK